MIKIKMKIDFLESELLVDVDTQRAVASQVRLFRGIFRSSSQRKIF